METVESVPPVAIGAIHVKVTGRAVAHGDEVVPDLGARSARRARWELDSKCRRQGRDVVCCSDPFEEEALLGVGRNAYA
jgi:hypothetical protein